ncbi:RNA-directed DNA polymerase, eukaryota, reverse transcriptase zinc-binding domain protein [Tanacetum coccineum]
MNLLQSRDTNPIQLRVSLGRPPSYAVPIFLRRHYIDHDGVISWVKWDSVLQSSESGGLGIDGGFSSRIGSGLHKSTWENVISSGVAIDTIGVPFRLSFLRDVKSGGETSFWNDIWTHSGQTLEPVCPKKVNICIWRAVNDRLPTRANLLLRGLTISSSLCPLCGLKEESLHHIILSCLVVSQLWSKFWKWWRINHPHNMSSISDVLDFSPPISKDHCKIYQASLYVFIREIWSWRNRFVHADLVSLSSIRNEDIFTQAQLLSLLWISSRGIKSSIDWITWKSNPFSILLRVM